jgi:hypothetical protein
VECYWRVVDHLQLIRDNYYNITIVRSIFYAAVSLFLCGRKLIAVKQKGILTFCCTWPYHFGNQFVKALSTITMENLNQLVARLMGNYLQLAVNNHSFFVNDIPSSVPVESNKDWLTSVISRMLSIVARNVRHTCIRLSAKQHGHVTVLEIQESGPVNGYALASDLQTVNMLAEQVGGQLSISIPKAEVTTISFSFPGTLSSVA